ncbi:MAG: holo-ACP synthase [Pseudomonadales bacterium]|nr:holo-ACP synthase [Pseudomonadales bacterium]
MIHGIGTDLVQVDRISRACARFGDRFARKILHEAEWQDYQADPGVLFVAKRFAAKEAVAKALGTGMGAGVHFTQIRIVRRPGLRPQVELHGKALQIADRLGTHRIHLSVSDEPLNVLAFAVLELL